MGVEGMGCSGGAGPLPGVDTWAGRDAPPSDVFSIDRRSIVTTRAPLPIVLSAYTPPCCGQAACLSTTRNVFTSKPSASNRWASERPTGDALGRGVGIRRRPAAVAGARGPSLGLGSGANDGPFTSLLALSWPVEDKRGGVGGRLRKLGYRDKDRSGWQAIELEQEYDYFVAEGRAVDCRRLSIMNPWRGVGWRRYVKFLALPARCLALAAGATRFPAEGAFRPQILTGPSVTANDIWAYQAPYHERWHYCGQVWNSSCIELPSY